MLVVNKKGKQLKTAIRHFPKTKFITTFTPYFTLLKNIKKPTQKKPQTYFLKIESKNILQIYGMFRVHNRRKIKWE